MVEEREWELCNGSGCQLNSRPRAGPSTPQPAWQGIRVAVAVAGASDRLGTAAYTKVDEKQGRPTTDQAGVPAGMFWTHLFCFP